MVNMRQSTDTAALNGNPAQQQQQEDTKKYLNIAREFVRQYYTMLSIEPEHVHRFYSDDSIFMRNNQHNDNPVRGQKAIQAELKRMNLSDCRAKIHSIRCSQTVSDSLLIQVVGELSCATDEPGRRFLQSFILCPQGPKKFYALNDIFCYVDESVATGGGATGTELGTTTTTGKSAPVPVTTAPAVQEDKVSASPKPAVGSEYSNGAVKHHVDTVPMDPPPPPQPQRTAAAAAPPPSAAAPDASSGGYSATTSSTSAAATAAADPVTSAPPLPPRNAPPPSAPSDTRRSQSPGGFVNEQSGDSSSTSAAAPPAAAKAEPATATTSAAAAAVDAPPPAKTTATTGSAAPTGSRQQQPPAAVAQQQPSPAPAAAPAPVVPEGPRSWANIAAKSSSNAAPPAAQPSPAAAAAPKPAAEARVNDSTTAAASVDGSEAAAPAASAAQQQQRDPSAGTCPYAGKNSMHAFMKSIPTNQTELNRVEAEFVRAMKAIDVGISSARLRPGKGDLNGHMAFAFIDFNTVEDADRCFTRCVQKRVQGTSQPRWVIELRMWNRQADIIVDEKKDEGRGPGGPGGPKAYAGQYRGAAGGYGGRGSSGGMQDGGHMQKSYGGRGGASTGGRGGQFVGRRVQTVSQSNQ